MCVHGLGAVSGGTAVRTQHCPSSTRSEAPRCSALSSPGSVASVGHEVTDTNGLSPRSPSPPSQSIFQPIYVALSLRQN